MLLTTRTTRNTSCFKLWMHHPCNHTGPSIVWSLSIWKCLEIAIISMSCCLLFALPCDKGSRRAAKRETDSADNLSQWSIFQPEELSGIPISESFPDRCFCAQCSSFPEGIVLHCHSGKSFVILYKQWVVFACGSIIFCALCRFLMCLLVKEKCFAFTYWSQAQKNQEHIGLYPSLPTMVSSATAGGERGKVLLVPSGREAG